MFFTIREEISNFKYDGVLEVVSEALRLTGFGGNCTANGSGRESVHYVSPQGWGQVLRRPVYRLPPVLIARE